MNDNRYEIDNRTKVNHEGPRANSPVQRLTATSIIGDAVENSTGDTLGRIDNLMIDLHQQRIDYAVIETGEFLGMGGKLFAIPFQELHIDPHKKVFILDAGKEYFSSRPGFDKTHWPGTNEKVLSDEIAPPFP
jgi:sporulation protein YlmC with PRC-barrel domain